MLREARRAGRRTEKKRSYDSAASDRSAGYVPPARVRSACSPDSLFVLQDIILSRKRERLLTAVSLLRRSRWNMIYYHGRLYQWDFTCRIVIIPRRIGLSIAAGRGRREGRERGNERTREKAAEKRKSMRRIHLFFINIECLRFIRHENI